MIQNSTTLEKHHFLICVNPAQNLKVLLTASVSSLYQDETPELKIMLQETLSLDPRPAYRQNKEDSQEYGVLFNRYNVRWKVQDKLLIVLEILIADTGH